jgi:hypothetical protein
MTLLTRLGDGKDRTVKGMSENRENGTSALLVYRVIAPFTLSDAAAVESQKTAKFGTLETDKGQPGAPAFPHSQHLAHLAPSKSH